jgi:hypothetical protein
MAHKINAKILGGTRCFAARPHGLPRLGRRGAGHERRTTVAIGGYDTVAYHSAGKAVPNEHLKEISTQVTPGAEERYSWAVLVPLGCIADQDSEK